MSAVFVGALLVAIPLLAGAVAVVAYDGWEMLGQIVAGLIVAAAASSFVTFGIYLIAEGWPS